MRRASTHDDVLELLPWFVNGTLSPAEHARVERHVHECLVCYSALQHERRVSSEVRDRSTARLSAEQGFERLMSRIDGPAAAKQGARSEGRQRAGSAFRFRVPAFAAGVAAAAAAAALVWIGVADGPGTRPATYETLSTSAPEAGGARLDIVFAEALSEAEMRRLLREIDATIVAGPTEIGRYTVRLERQVADDELSATVARLEQDERVRFVGPSFMEEGR